MDGPGPDSRQQAPKHNARDVGGLRVVDALLEREAFDDCDEDTLALTFHAAGFLAGTQFACDEVCIVSE
jgi:hypothetical protein